jgi:hypothetical protein
VARARFSALLVAVCLAVAACGGGGGGSSSGNNGTGDAGVGTAASAQAAKIKSCLQDASLEPKVNPLKAFGVDDPFIRFSIPLHDKAFDEDYHAEVYVFESKAAATKNRPAITLQSEDDQRNKVIGNVLVTYGIVPEKDAAASVEACV